MKKYNGILILLTSFGFTALGSVLKIKHLWLSEAFLILGITAFVIAIVIILRKLFRST